MKPITQFLVNNRVKNVKSTISPIVTTSFNDIKKGDFFTVYFDGHPEITSICKCKQPMPNEIICDWVIDEEKHIFVYSSISKSMNAICEPTQEQLEEAELAEDYFTAHPDILKSYHEFDIEHNKIVEN